MIVYLVLRVKVCNCKSTGVQNCGQPVGEEIMYKDEYEMNKRERKYLLDNNVSSPSYIARHRLCSRLRRCAFLIPWRAKWRGHYPTPLFDGGSSMDDRGEKPMIGSCMLAAFQLTLPPIRTVQVVLPNYRNTDLTTLECFASGMRGLEVQRSKHISLNVSKRPLAC